MNFQENLKQARLDCGLTQKELAEKIKVFPHHICRWESGERTPNIEKLRDMCLALNVSSDTLLEIKIQEDEKMNKYLTLMEACKVAEEKLEGNLLVDNSGTEWDTFNLMDCESQDTDDDNYYCVGWDGRIGFTNNNGVNVDWIYKVKED